MWRNVQTYIVVTIVALLIWMLAESEGVRTQSIRVTLILAADGDGRRLLEVDPSYNGTPMVTLNGAVANIDVLTRELRSAIRLAPPMPGLPAEPGDHNIDLRTVLSAYPPIRDGGVTVTDVDPAFVRVRIDDMVSREAKVVVRAPEGSLTGVPTPNPPTVTVRVPSRLAERLPQALEVYAVVSPTTLAALPIGKFGTIPEVLLAPPDSVATLPGAEHIRIEPAAVSVSLTPAGDEISRTLTAIPVQVLIPPIEMNRWEITIDQSDFAIPEAQITGPADLVQQAVDKRLLVVAMVQPTFVELENAARTGEPLVKEALFSSVPPSTLRIEALDRSVTLTVKARPQPPAGPTESPTPGG